MKGYRSGVLAAVALAAVTALPAQAQNVMASSPQSIEAVLKARGLPSELKQGGQSLYPQRL